jgi:hypothetical protein
MMKKNLLLVIREKFSIGVSGLKYDEATRSGKMITLKITGISVFR